MKKLLFIILALLLSLSACSSPAGVGQSPVPSQSVSASVLPTATLAAAPTKTAMPTPMRTATPTPAPTASPSAAQSVTPAPTASPSPAKDITAIIATSYGEIIGGYSKGKWLSAGGAAAYCKGKKTFSMYTLAEFKGEVKSSGVTYDDEYTDPGCYYLNIPEGGNDEYSEDPLISTYMYYGGKLPDIEIVSDTSEVSRALQNLLDEKRGEGNAEPNISVAVMADIDGDGQKETVVNADGILNDADDTEYRVCCIIESDSTVKIIGDYNFTPTEEGSYFEPPQLFYVQNIIDIDGDGKSELVIDVAWGEEYGTSVYKYDGKNVSEVIDYWVIEECP